MKNKTESASKEETAKKVYERPTLRQQGTFAEKTQGSAGPLAFDFHLSDRPS
jgi:hypothetical protein